MDGVTAVTQVTFTGTLTSGSPTVTGISSTASLNGALGVSGVGLPDYTYVQSIDSLTQITLTQAATSSGSVSLTANIEPVTLPEARFHCRDELLSTDSAIVLDNALIAELVSAARRYCETQLKSALLTQSWVLYLDSFPSAGGYYNRAIREIWPSIGGLPSGLGFYPGLVPNSTGVIDIPLEPLQSITSVNYTDFEGNTDTVATSAYDVSIGMQGRIQPAYSKVWPISRPTIDSVQITFVAGYGSTASTIPPHVKLAIKMLVAHWYENREACLDQQLWPVPLAIDSLLSPSATGKYC